MCSAPHERYLAVTVKEERFVPSVRKGGMDRALLSEMIPDPTGYFVYLCGPGISTWEREAAKERGTQPEPRFIEAALANLRALGVPDHALSANRTDDTDFVAVVLPDGPCDGPQHGSDRHTV